MFLSFPSFSFFLSHLNNPFVIPSLPFSFSSFLLPFLYYFRFSSFFPPSLPPSFPSFLNSFRLSFFTLFIHSVSPFFLYLSPPLPSPSLSLSYLPPSLTFPPFPTLPFFLIFFFSKLPTFLFFLRTSPAAYRKHKTFTV